MLSALTRSGSALEHEPVDPGDPTWVPLDDVRAGWAVIVRRYAEGLRTPHIEPGAACALQHYAGRWLPVPVAFWWVTGELLDTRPAVWWARVDDTGATRAVSCVEPRSVGAVDVDGLLEACVRHLEPMVAGSLATSRLVADVVWGSAAASLAGALGLMVRSAPSDARAAAIERAATIMHTPSPLTRGRRGRSLIDLFTAEADDGVRLGHERRTCCLIRLGDSHGVCASCPVQPRAELVERTRTTAISRRPTVPLETIAEGTR